MNIASRISMIRDRIAHAATRAGRDPEEVKLMAVSKFQERSRIDEALDSGIMLLGESRVQEIRDKYDLSAKPLPDDVELHFIGRLQRNKVRQAVKYCNVIESVDRDDLIPAIIQACSHEDRKMSVFFELNTGEESKAGYRDLDALSHGVELALASERIIPAGLMTMAPFTSNENEIRVAFRSLAACRELLYRRFSLPVLELSMGMSSDFEIAIEEGATLVRVGTLLFEGVQT